MVCLFLRRPLSSSTLDLFQRRIVGEGDSKLRSQLCGQQCSQLFFLARRLARVQALYRVPYFKSVKGLFSIAFLHRTIFVVSFLESS